MAKLVMEIHEDKFEESGQYVENVLTEIMEDFGVDRYQAIQLLNDNIYDYFDYRLSDWMSEVYTEAYVVDE